MDDARRQSIEGGYHGQDSVIAANKTDDAAGAVASGLEGVGGIKNLDGEEQLDPEHVVEEHEMNSPDPPTNPRKVAVALSRTQSAHTTDSSITSSEIVRTPPQSPNDLIRKDHRWYHYLLFQRKHLPPVPKERTHSPEYEASFLSIVTWQWMAPLMSKGYQRPLEHNDIWSVNPSRRANVMTKRLTDNFEKRRRQPNTHSPLLWALYDTFKSEFVLGGACQLTSSTVQVINPFILRYLIDFATEAYAASRDSSSIPPNFGHGIGLVLAVTILQFIQSSCANHFLYRGMINGGQARAVLISVIFDKAMTISGRARAGGKSTETPPVNLQPGSKEEKSRFMSNLGKKEKKSLPRDKRGISGDGQGWSNGRILNVMSTDSYRIDQASGMFHMIWTSPIAIFLTLILLLINIGYSALAGFGLFCIATPILVRVIQSLFHRRRPISKITDQRVNLTQEILQSVRFVKIFGWEESFQERISELRRTEIRLIQFLLATRNGINAISVSMPVFASMLAFITYSLTNHGLNASLVFSSLALFNSLRIPLNMLPLVIGQLVDAISSADRIQAFLLEEDAKDESDWNFKNDNAIDVKDASFTWERLTNSSEENGVGDFTKTFEQGKEVQKTEKTQAAEERRLSKQSLKPASKSSLNGPDSSSSSSFDEKVEPPFKISDISFSVGRKELIAVIGSVGSGKSSLLAALAGEMRKTAGSVTLGATRAFCPQYAWIQNMTVKDNILFGKAMDKSWYNEVVDACALRADLDMLPSGDLTEIGERGITVSGGQKQRLNIARAIYFDSDLVLMDDPLSAVDAYVGRHIMDEAICGLLQNKCRILATHQLWVLSRCDKIIWMQEGRIAAFDTFHNLMDHNADFKTLIAKNAQEETKEQGDEDRNGDGDGDRDGMESEKPQRNTRKSKKRGAALMQAEERAISDASKGVYAAYIKASGSWLTAPLVILLLILTQGSTIATSLWLSWWTSDKFGYTKGIYIGVYAALGVASAFLMFIFALVLSSATTNASRTMLDRALTRVLRAPMLFFDTTPLGRITNRFSKDIDVLDNVISESYRMAFISMGMIVSVFILIVVYYYYFIIALGPLFLVFIAAAGFYRASAREIKRHESVLRSHVFAKFSEAVIGTATIRAYGLGDHFSECIRDTIDQMDSAYFLTMSNQRWLSVRLDIIGNLLVFVVGILVVTSSFSIDPATGGLVLSYILSIVPMIQFTVRQLAEVENNMNSAERIHYYGTQLEEEAPPHIPSRELVPSWPQKGEIEFCDVQMRYRAGLPLALQDFSLHIKPGERIGVVGRTGAGKSSIMGTLFRLVELSGGSIQIDGIDISTVGLADLRVRLAIIPQDPTLFKGTIRSNLDPFNKHDDLKLWSALRQADLVNSETIQSPTNEKGVATEQMTTSGAKRMNLDTLVEEEGLNFSLGQQQLMALARAIVRSAQIIVCDEATSSVDMETDKRIQKSMLESFRGKTVLCIAHRLKTILGYDRIVVMDNGRVSEVGTPWELWKLEGAFRGMCARSMIREEDFVVKK